MRGIQRIDWDAATETVVAQPFASFLVHDAFVLAGRADLLLASVRRWSDFLHDGYDSFGECWGWGTPAHGWSSTPTRDLVQAVLGVTPAEPGFVRARIAPAYGHLQRMEGVVPTPAGAIRVLVDGTRLELDTPVPSVVVRANGEVVEVPAGSHRL